MDIHLEMTERRRVSEEFRARIASLAVLRTQLADAKTDEARQHLYAAVDKEAELCRQLSGKLLALERSVHEMRLRKLGKRLSPLNSTPLDF